MIQITTILTCFVLLLQANPSRAQFDKYFHNKTLRMDYTHCGNSELEEIYFEELLGRFENELDRYHVLRELLSQRL